MAMATGLAAKAEFDGLLAQPETNKTTSALAITFFMNESINI
jgi:hypothetical protein